MASYFYADLVCLYISNFIVFPIHEFCPKRDKLFLSGQPRDVRKSGPGCLIQPLQVGWLLAWLLVGADDGPGPFQESTRLNRPVEAGMADLVEARRQDVLTRTVEKLY